MACRPNTHRPSFHVNMVGLEKTQRSNSCRYPWDLDAEMLDEDEEAFELWLQHALASGFFCESSKRRKSWSPLFNLHHKKGKKHWHRRTSCWVVEGKSCLAHPKNQGLEVLDGICTCNRQEFNYFWQGGRPRILDTASRMLSKNVDWLDNLFCVNLFEKCSC